MPTKPISFHDFGFQPELIATLTALGYLIPTQVQAESIPIIYRGEDLVAQAATGTGKTAAFALPIMANINLAKRAPQALIMTPTRELAIQVAGVFKSYSTHLHGFSVAPIYGGQDYKTQLRLLKNGAHVIVGTPGRLMDHLRRGSLSTEFIRTVVLDEGDEMLKMGFIDDITWILEQIPAPHQTALFSATMPESIKRIAQRYLNDPQKVHVKAEKNAVETIEQCYMCVNKSQKVEALSRFLEIEDFQAAIIFVRTKQDTVDLASQLQTMGYAVSALNGDLNQQMRERTIAKIKNSELDIIVATDVAARGLDVDRITHVVNFDLPHNVESYVHRIGRTGRAGRQGKALILIGPREQRLLREIERFTHKPMQEISAPTAEEIATSRSKQLTEKIKNIIEKSKKLSVYQKMVGTIVEESHQSPEDIAAALIYLLEQNRPLPENNIATTSLKEEQRTHHGKDRFERSTSRGSFSGNKSKAERTWDKPKSRSYSEKSYSKDTERTDKNRQRPTYRDEDYPKRDDRAQRSERSENYAPKSERKSYRDDASPRKYEKTEKRGERSSASYSERGARSSGARSSSERSSSARSSGARSSSERSEYGEKKSYRDNTAPRKTIRKSDIEKSRERKSYRDDTAPRKTEKSRSGMNKRASYSEEKKGARKDFSASKGTKVLKRNER
jgi:ATP-dependent RNA helicase DeaD